MVAQGSMRVRQISTKLLSGASRLVCFEGNCASRQCVRGKGGCNGASNVVPAVVHNALINEELLDPTTRELIIFMAQRKHGPSIDGTDKQGWWAADEYVWVYYDTKLFTAPRVPPADGFDGSSQMHAIYGRAVATEAATINGPINCRGVFCGCPPCMAHDFSPGACQMRAEYGDYKIEYVPRTVARDPRTTRTQVTHHTVYQYQLVFVC